jgi:HSP20 family protein
MTNPTATEMAPTQSKQEMLPREMQSSDPFRSMDRLLDRFFGRRSPWLDREESFALAAWMPACDIIETENEFVVKAELPEVKKEDVSVTFEDNTLTLRGERRFDAQEQGEQFHRIESRYGEFMRSFRLPQSVDADKIHAECKDGVLKVSLPKRPEAKPKQIEVRVK